MPLVLLSFAVALCSTTSLLSFLPFVYSPPLPFSIVQQGETKLGSVFEELGDGALAEAIGRELA